MIKLTMSRQNSNAHFHSAGFTLIETIIAIVLIGILAAVVIIANPFDSIKLTNAKRKVIADIRYVQKLAISNQTRAGMTFNVNGYDVYSNIITSTRAMSPGDTCSSDASNNFIVDFLEARCSNYSGITLTFSTATIAFNPLGKPVTAGGIDLGNQTVTVTLGSSSQTINIEAGTGRVY